MGSLAKDEVEVMKKETRAEDSKDKRDSLNLDLEKLHPYSGGDCCRIEQVQKQHLSKDGIPKVEKTGNLLI